MSVGESVRFNLQKEKEKEQPKVFPEVVSSRVNLNDLMKRLREEEKKTKRNSLTFSAVALSVAVVFGVILTL